jgi:hypothetical protein
MIGVLDHELAAFPDRRYCSAFDPEGLFEHGQDARQGLYHDDPRLRFDRCSACGTSRRRYSRSSPAISMPVKPAPATTKVSILQLGDGVGFLGGLARRWSPGAACMRIASSKDQRVKQFVLDARRAEEFWLGRPRR